MITHRRNLAPTALVLPAGNMFNDQLSAQITDAHFTQGRAELRWFAPPCDMTSSFAEIWLPGAPEGYEFTLTSPAGEVTTLAAPGFGDVTAGGRIVGLVMLDHPRQTRWRASFCLAPTEPKAPPPPGHAAAPAGEWRIAIRRPATATGTLALRIQRDVDHAQGNTGARQSRLIDPAYVTHDGSGAPAQTDGPGMVQRFDGLNGLASQAVSLNVGGRVATLQRAARYSSAGPVGGRGVDLSASSDRGVARPGVLSWGVRSGSFSAQSGTSSAAPEVARLLAERFLTAGAAGPVADNYLSLLAPLGEPVYGAPDAPDGPTRLGQVAL